MFIRGRTRRASLKHEDWSELPLGGCAPEYAAGGWFEPSDDKGPGLSGLTLCGCLVTQAGMQPLLIIDGFNQRTNVLPGPGKALILLEMCFLSLQTL
jgi:hypothetical protein